MDSVFVSSLSSKHNNNNKRYNRKEAARMNVIRISKNNKGVKSNIDGGGSGDTTMNRKRKRSEVFNDKNSNNSNNNNNNLGSSLIMPKKNNYVAQGNGLMKKLQSFEKSQNNNQIFQIRNLEHTDQPNTGSSQQEQESSSILEIIENKFQKSFTPRDIEKLESMFSQTQETQNSYSKRMSTISSTSDTLDDSSSSYSSSFTEENQNIIEAFPKESITQQPLDQIKLKVRIILSKDLAKDGDRLQWSTVRKNEA